MSRRTLLLLCCAGLLVAMATIPAGGMASATLSADQAVQLLPGAFDEANALLAPEAAEFVVRAGGQSDAVSAQNLATAAADRVLGVALSVYLALIAVLAFAALVYFGVACRQTGCGTIPRPPIDLPRPPRQRGMGRLTPTLQH